MVSWQCVVNHAYLTPPWTFLAHTGMMLDGAQVEVTLAKPVDKDTYLRSPKLGRPCSMPAFYVPVDQYGSVLPYYPSYFSPPRCLYLTCKIYHSVDNAPHPLCIQHGK